jgi:peptidyl-prolyl cis-trans isomerase B (cyclophilin B)
MKKIICLIALLLPAVAFTQTSKKGMAKPAPKQKESMVDIITDFGTMRVKLYNETPAHRDNFLKLAKEGFYDGTLFHRVINSFMIQGGDPGSKTAGPDMPLGGGDIGYTIPAEFNPALFHKKGALCAARTSNPAKASSGCQFYIVHGRPVSEQELAGIETQKGIKYTAEQKAEYVAHGGVPFLDQDYTVYGEVISGMDVIDKIALTQTKPGDRPVKDVKMTMKVVE